jgi:NAD(P)H-nitrite reductase large subunit
LPTPGHDRGRQKYQHAVVIGGGLLGLEAANGLMLRGMRSAWCM